MTCTVNFTKAPNGRESNLFNSLKTQFGEKQALKTWVATQTPTFEDEFGKTKIKDENGEPLIMYMGKQAQSKRSVPKLGKGIYLTSNKKQANAYNNSWPLFVNSDNVRVYENLEDFNKAVKESLNIKTTPTKAQRVVFVDKLHNQGIDVALEGFTELNIHSQDQFKIAVDLNSDQDIMYPIRQKAAADRNKALESRLKAFLSTFGVTVEAYDNLIEKTGLDSTGVADMANKLILIANDKADVTTLPEEVGHFIFELLGEENPLVQRMKALAEKSEVYQNILNDPNYKAQYGENTEMYLNEAVGKLIGNALISKFEEQNTPKTLMNTIKRIWERVKSIFKNGDRNKLITEVEQIYGDLASNILMGDPTGLSDANINTDRIYFQDPGVPKFTQDSAEIVSSLNTKADLGAVLENLKLQGLVSTNNKSVFTNDSGRDMILFDVDGVAVPFYRSFKGTSEKTKGKWYPFLFVKEDWIAKGYADNYESSYGIKVIKDIQDSLNENYRYDSPKATVKHDEKESFKTITGQNIGPTFKGSPQVSSMLNPTTMRIAAQLFKTWNIHLGGDLNLKNYEKYIDSVENQWLETNKNKEEGDDSEAQIMEVFDSIRALFDGAVNAEPQITIEATEEEQKQRDIEKAKKEEEEGEEANEAQAEKDQKKVKRTLDKLERLINKTKNAIQEKIDRLEKTSTKSDKLAQVMLVNLKFQQSALDGEDAKKAIVVFLKKAQKDMAVVKNRFTDMKESGEAKAVELLRYRRYVENYSNKLLMDLFEEVKDDPAFKELIPSEHRALFRTTFLDLNESIETLFKDMAIPLMRDALQKVNANTNFSKEDIEQQLLKGSKDVGLVQQWLETMAESPDTILALGAKMVNEQKEKGREETLEFRNKLIDKINEFEKFRSSAEGGGIKIGNPKALYNIFYERNAAGALNGRLKKWTAMVEEFGVDSKEMEFYKYFTETYHKMQSKLPVNFTKGLNMPSIRTTAKEKIASGESMTGAVKEEFLDTFTLQLDDTGFGSDGTITKSANRFVPVLFHAGIGDGDGMISADDISYDLGNSLQAFGTMAINNAHMNSIVSELELLKEILAERQVIKTAGDNIITLSSNKFGLPEDKGDTIEGKQSKIYAVYERYLDMVVYGMRKDSQETITIGGKTIPKTKLIDALNKYSSLRALGLNLFSGMSNLTMGKTMNFIEGHAGQFFNKKEYLSAEKEYAAGMIGFLKDINLKKPTSKIGQMVDLFDGLQDYDEYGSPISGNKLWKRLISTNSAFFLQKGGEHSIQVTLMIAFLKGKKIKTEAGEEISLYDAYEQKDGELVLKKGIKYEQLERIRDVQKMKQISQKLHGVYNSQDLIGLQNVWAGRAAILFRKWLYPSFKRRWGSTRFSQRLASDEEGNYLTAWKFIRSVFPYMKANSVGLWSGVTGAYGAQEKFQKENMRRFGAEAMAVMAIMILIGMISGLDDEDEERSWLENMTLFQLYRLRGEMSMYLNPKEAMHILKSPAASMSAIENVMKLFYQVVGGGWSLAATGEMPAYARDTGLFDEGDWKIRKPFEELWPLWKEFRAVQAPENRLKWMLWQ